VHDIFWPTTPDLPIPQTITRPAQARIFLTTSEKVESIRLDIAIIASASTSQTSLAWDISSSVEHFRKGSAVVLSLFWNASLTRDVDLSIKASFAFHANFL
jgi:histidinol dehydrogenase